MRAIERDFYQYVPKHLQDPLCVFLIHGIEPQQPELKAELNGHADGHGDLGVRTFLARHSARFDVAHGNAGYVARWMMRGGEAGRANLALAIAITLASALAMHHFQCFCLGHFWC